MALFKILKGQLARLPNTSKLGYAYYTTDKGKFYIFNSETLRRTLNPDIKITIGNQTKTSTTLSPEVAFDLASIGAAAAGHNHDNRYLKLSGGTMTGTITLLGNQYADSYSGALNANNSNIYGVHSIYTANLADTSAEGIHFYRTSTTVDSLWIKNGVIYFTPNRTLGKTGTDYTVIHSGNYTDYTVKKDGTGATGTWYISIPWANTNHPATFPPSDHNHDNTYIKKAGDTMDGTAVIAWPDSGNWGNSNKDVTFPVVRGGLSWSGQSDYIKLNAVETGNDNLLLYLQFGDDNSNGLSIRNAANQLTARISTSGIFTGNGSGLTNLPAGNLTGIISMDRIADRSIGNGKLTNSKITIAGKDVSLGGSLTLADIGLSTAMHFIGIATVAIKDGDTIDPKISGYDFSKKQAGDVIIDKDKFFEYVWTSSAWERLGGDSSYKVTQSVVNSPGASGNTTAFIDTISQNANGVISVTKKNLDTSGTWSGTAAKASAANLTTTTNAIAKYSNTTGTFANSGVLIDENNNVTIPGSIKNLAVGGGIYWNPHVESDSDASDAASITVLKSGVVGGTLLRIQQQNDSTDIINLMAPYYIYLNSKRAFTINDTWLRINQDAAFSAGTYFGSSVVRTDNQFQVGDSGNKFYVNSGGNGYFSNNVSIAGTDTSYKLYVNGKSYFTGTIRAKTAGSSWIGGLKGTDRSALLVTDATDSDSYWPWISHHNISSKRYFSLGQLANSIYLIGTTDTRTTNGYDYGWRFDFSNGVMAVPGNIQPVSTNTQTLGTSSLRWAKVYIGTADTYGSTTKGVYWNAGVPTAMTYELKSTVNNGTATRIAYYSGTNAVSSGSIVTDGSFLHDVSSLYVTKNDWKFALGHNYTNQDAYLSADVGGISIQFLNMDVGPYTLIRPDFIQIGKKTSDGNHYPMIWTDNASGSITANGTIKAGSKLQLWTDEWGGNIDIIDNSTTRHYQFDAFNGNLRLYSQKCSDNSGYVGITLLDTNGNTSTGGSLWISQHGDTGGGIHLADDGGFYDFNDGFGTAAFTSGLKIARGKDQNNTAIELWANGLLWAASKVAVNAALGFAEEVSIQAYNSNTRRNLYMFNNVDGRMGLYCLLGGSGLVFCHANQSNYTLMWCHAYHTLSDIRLKRNIQNLNLKLNISFIRLLNPVEFQFKQTNKYSFGFIAQDVLKIMNKFNLNDKYNLVEKTLLDPSHPNVKRYYSINYTELIAPTIKAVQYLDKEIEKNKLKENKLKQLISKLKSLIQLLNAKLDTLVVSHL